MGVLSEGLARNYRRPVWIISTMLARGQRSTSQTESPPPGTGFYDWYRGGNGALTRSCYRMALQKSTRTFTFNCCALLVCDGRDGVVWFA